MNSQIDPDFSKAFDRGATYVKIALRTMELEVFSCCKLIIGEASSYPCIVTSGVPQGTVLDALLFMFCK